MLDVIDKINEKGNPVCEDVIGYSDTYIYVIDGASGLSGINVTDGSSDPAWFVQRVNELLADKLNSSNGTIKQLLKQVCETCLDEYLDFTKEHNATIPPDSPSASLSLFRLKDQVLEYFGLGDCTGVVEYQDNTFEVFHDETLTSFDDGVIGEMVRIHKKRGISVLEARTQCRGLLLENRQKRNKKNGYWTLDLSGKGVDHAMNYRLDLNKAVSLSVFTDGFAQLADVFHEYDNYEELHKAIKTKPLAELYNKLFAMQSKDSLANKYPRFKLRDDTSCVFAKIRR